MKKQIQTPAGFQTVDSFVLEEQKYFSPEELPRTEQIALRAAYAEAITDLQAILDSNASPVIDTFPKTQAAIRQCIVAIQKVVGIELKELKYHKCRDMDI